MKQEIFLKREQQSRKEWLPGGKHSGSLVIPSGQEEILRAGEVDLPASVRAALESGRIRGEDREIRACDLRLKRFRRKNKVSILFLVDASRSQGAKRGFLLRKVRYFPFCGGRTVTGTGQEWWFSGTEKQN